MDKNKNIEPKGRAKKNPDNNKAPFIEAPFCKQLNKLYGERNESQESAAEALNTTRQSFGNWLAGRNQPDYEMLVRIANYYNVSADYLLGLSKEKSVEPDLVSAARYTGLSEEALKALTAHCGNDLQCDVPAFVLNELLLSDYFYVLLHTLGNIEISSGMLEAIDDYPTYKDVWNECDVNRYRAFKTLEKISDLYDRRENHGKHQGEPK